jgi:hypothetical protein
MKQEIDETKYLSAIKMGCQTLVGHLETDFPRERGNCFDLSVDGEREYRIVNFNAENFQELLKRGLTYPIKIIQIAGHTAIIHDERIPHDWYQSRWCECCCPSELLPLTQQLKHHREELTGERKVFRGESLGMPCDMVRIDTSKAPKF